MTGDACNRRFYTFAKQGSGPLAQTLYINLSMKMIKVYIREGQVYSNPIAYILSVFAVNKQVPIEIVANKAEAQLIFDDSDPDSFPINTVFYDSLLNKMIHKHEFYFREGPWLLFPDSVRKDWLGTAFYMISAFQEFDNKDLDAAYFDKFGRFRYEKSYQHKFDCIESNLVQLCFDSFCKEHPVFCEAVTRVRPTRIFISHDIDTIHGSFLQDGLWALKKGRIDIIMKLLFNELMSNPGWFNIDKIEKLHSEHDLKSTFFWLATKKLAANGVKNADYAVQNLAAHGRIVSKSNGLHKSCYTTSFDEELAMLPFETTLNRYHFLKFTIPASWHEIEESKLQLDASLGYAERYGFRNNYGLPFRPYNVSTQKAYDFIELPLNIMDGTLHRYMHVPLDQTASRIIDFIEKNNINAIVSILWHNTYFTEYKFSGYLQEYKKVLLYLKASGIKSVTPEEIIKEF